MPKKYRHMSSYRGKIFSHRCKRRKNFSLKSLRHYNIFKNFVTNFPMSDKTKAWLWTGSQDRVGQRKLRRRKIGGNFVAKNEVIEMTILVQVGPHKDQKYPSNKKLIWLYWKDVKSKLISERIHWLMISIRKKRPKKPDPFLCQGMHGRYVNLIQLN